MSCSNVNHSEIDATNDSPYRDSMETPEHTDPQTPDFEQSSSVDGQISAISFGSSFGECLGYCSDALRITGETTVYVAKSNLPGTDSPDLTAEQETDQDVWMGLMNTINLEQYNKLPEVIGCPDCYDQGAEWIEVTYNDNIQRLDIEFGAEIPELEAILPTLRSMREAFKKEVGN